MMRSPGTVWKVYKKFIGDYLRGTQSYTIKDIHSWREQLFLNIVLYSTPLSLLALIPSVVVLLANGFIFIPVFDLFALLTIPLFTIFNAVPLRYRKAYVVVVFYMLAIIMMGSLGSFGIGSIYLLALSVFIALLFSRRVLVWSVIANFVVYGAFAFIIYYQLFDLPIIYKYSLEFWLIFSSNFLFLNLAVVVTIRFIIRGLEKIVLQEGGLRMSLESEMNEKERLNRQLTDSEGHYRSLFFRNPSPMWIYDAETLRFLQVNIAAVRKYGYTRDEFKTMTIKDIRPAEEIPDLVKLIRNIDDSQVPTSFTVKHQTKSGQIFYAEVRGSNIPYQGKDERLIIARDITDQIEYTKAIEKQNALLREIAYMQSHIVRAPLSRILGLVYIITSNIDKDIDKEVIQYLDESAKELDEVIKAIIGKTEEANRDL